MFETGKKVEFAFIQQNFGIDNGINLRPFSYRTLYRLNFFPLSYCCSTGLSNTGEMYAIIECYLIDIVGCLV